MKWLLVLGLAIALVGASQTQAFVVKESPYVEIWTDRGDGAIYHAGEAAAIFIRPQQDCYVIVYEIDTDGYLRVLFPSDCFYDGFVRGGRIYRIGRGPLRRLYVSGPAGVAYVHVIASFEPFRTIYWHGCSGYDAYAYDVTWRGFTDYWGCALPPRIYGDPYVAMESIDEFICLDRIEFGVVWADFTYFYVDTRVPYPRYVCYDCHGFSSHVRPYSSVCLGFTITFVDCDPCCHPWSWWWWCSPKRVYCGPRYVCYARKPCPKYPSVYKWKSRMESRSAPRVSLSRHQVSDDGNLRRGERVKTKRKVLDLYSRSEPRGEKSVRDVRKVEVRRRSVSAPQPHRSLRKDTKVDRSRSKISSGRKASRLESKKRSHRSKSALVSSVRRAKTRKAVSTMRSKTRGKSHIKRRHLSR